MYYKNNQKCFLNDQNHQQNHHPSNKWNAIEKVSLLNNTEKMRLGQLEVYEVKTAAAKLKIQNK